MRDDGGWCWCKYGVVVLLLAAVMVNGDADGDD